MQFNELKKLLKAAFNNGKIGERNAKTAKHNTKKTLQM